MNIKMINKTMVTLLLITTLILLTNITTYGQTNNETLETPGIHGEVSCKYELLSYNPGQEWTVDLHYRLPGWLSWVSVGALQTTYTDGFDQDFSFLPTNQLYDIYLKVEYKQVSLQVGQWCNHPVNSDTEIQEIESNIINLINISHGIYLYGKYKF
jgi:hypothetical protein